MATDTVPAAVPGPPDPPGDTTQAGQPARGFLASMVAPVQPARPTFDLHPTTSGADAETTTAGPDQVLDASAPGVSSASFRDTTDHAAKNSDPAGARHKRSIWKEMWLAAATRWAKGGGTANKRLDLAKAKAQAKAHQVKENRTVTQMNSGGLPVRNTGGSGAGSKGNSGKSGRDSAGKGPVNSSGNRSGGAGRGGGSGSGGGRGGTGSSGSSGASGSGAGGGKGRHGAHNGGSGKSPSAGGDKHTGSGSGSGSSGKGQGAGRDGGKTRHSPSGSSGTGSSGTGGSGGGTGKQGGSGKHGKDGAAGKDGKPGKTDLTKQPSNAAKQDGQSGQHKGGVQKTPLQKSRETGHQDGGAVRNVVDHVKAYKDGVVDGYRDTKTRNAKEHDRLTKAHDAQRQKTTDPKAPQTPNGPANGSGPDATQPGSGPLTAVTQGQKITIEDDNAPLEDPLMGKATPIQAKGIDTNKITLGEGFLKTSIKRSELRTFKQYENRLEARIDGFARVVDATKALAAQAREQAHDCLTLLEDAKNVEGGAKLVTALQKLTDQATAQADEADEVHAQALKAHDFGKAVLSNVQTRYQPLYQAVVDSDETKPAELRFYKDRGITRSSTTLAA